MYFHFSRIPDNCHIFEILFIAKKRAVFVQIHGDLHFAVLHIDAIQLSDKENISVINTKDQNDTTNKQPNPLDYDGISFFELIEDASFCGFQVHLNYTIAFVKQHATVYYTIA